MSGYYSKHSSEYIAATIDADMSETYALFEPLLKGKKILDVGFGSGRDMLYFRSKGYEVYGIDNEPSFVEHAKALGLQVCLEDVLTFQTEERFDGIWANASLLHLSKKRMADAIDRLKGLLKKGGVLFVSLKEGDGETIDEKGRAMTYINKEYLEDLGFRILSITGDALGREVRWVNAVYDREVIKAPTPCGSAHVF